MIRVGIVVCTAAAISAGCSVQSPILKEGESISGFDSSDDIEGVVLNEDSTGSQRYRIFHRGSTAEVPLSDIIHAAQIRATSFCNQQGKTLVLLEEKSAAPAFNSPRIEYIFTCVEKNKSS